MVVRSTINYSLHKQQVYEKISKVYGKRRAKKFIDFYASRWDKFNRTYLDYRFAFCLTDDYYHVKNLGTLFYAIVGTGGMGKTTLAANMFYYLDPTLDASRANITSVKKFVMKLSEYSMVNAKKSIFMDEPDDSIASTSKLGKQIREIAGKWRQQQLFLGILATDIADIPVYLFRKLHGIVFLPKHGKGMFFRNSPKKERYVVQSMRMEYLKLGWRVFYKYRKEKGCLEFKTHKGIVYEDLLYQQYLKEKANDYSETIKRVLDELEHPSKHSKQMQEAKKNAQLVKKLRDKDMSYSQIASIVGLTKGRISQILNK